MSVGWAGSSASGEFDNDGYEPMNSVFDQYSGLLICAAGNHYRNIDDDDAEWDIYPQQYDDDLLLVVSASTDEDAIWYNPVNQKGSNVGEESVDLFAPGKDIATTVKGGGRGTMTGTSAAAPMVAGVAAMILSMYPDLSDDMIKIKEYIIDRADDSSDGVTAFSGKCVSGGRLNAFEAVKEAIDDNAPEEPEPCQHEGDVYYTQYNDTSHRVKCYDCDEVLETVAHEGYNTNYGSSGHQFYCTVCGYSAMRDHDIYISAVNNGVYTIKCHGCSYVRNCSCGCEFEPDGDMGHDLTCMDCNYSIFEDHTYELSGDYDSSGHEFECIYCYYSEYVDHDLYMDSAESGEYVVKCYDCNYSVECWEDPVYYGNSDDGHSMSCPDGCYSIFEPHTYTYIDTGNGTHTVTCVYCGYAYTAQHLLYRAESETENLFDHIIGCLICEYKSTEAHTWKSSSLGYRCTVCGMVSDSVPGIMSLPDPELEAYLASLSVEELEEFIASLPEDQVERVTALLPSDDEHLTE